MGEKKEKAREKKRERTRYGCVLYGCVFARARVCVLADWHDFCTAV